MRRRDLPLMMATGAFIAGGAHDALANDAIGSAVSGRRFAFIEHNSNLIGVTGFDAQGNPNKPIFHTSSFFSYIMQFNRDGTGVVLDGKEVRNIHNVIGPERNTYSSLEAAYAPESSSFIYNFHWLVQNGKIVISYLNKSCIVSVNKGPRNRLQYLIEVEMPSAAVPKKLPKGYVPINEGHLSQDGKTIMLFPFAGLHVQQTYLQLTNAGTGAPFEFLSETFTKFGTLIG